MLERLKYKNHLNEVFDFGKDGIYVETNDLRDYEWKVTEKNNRITALERVTGSKSLPVVIICNTEDEGIRIRNKLFEATEKDVLAMKHGQIIIGDYYFRCFVTKSQKADYLISKRHLRLNLTLTSDFPYWVKETSHLLEGGKSGAANVDYPFDYPFDYVGTNQLDYIINANFVSSNFKMIIYGACSNPTVYVNDHTYQVNCDVAADEYLTIDSVAKTVTLTKGDGTIVNQFRNRCRDSYIFEKIPSGKLPVTWDGALKMTIILLEERSEPKWT